MSKVFRYPGASPFETYQQRLFFGREHDTELLYRQIKLEQLVVLYSKSGLGKSSLLNAGIVPLVERDARLQSMRVRFRAWSPGKLATPADITRALIAPTGSERTFLDSLIKDEPTLWHNTKEFQIKNQGQKGLFLIFDQFEELFTYPKPAIAEFQRQLAETLYSDIPDRYSKVLEEQFEKGEVQLNEQQMNLLQTPIDLKVIFAIRSDRMHLLEQLSDHLPNILKNCYELLPLDIRQAESAIYLPARYQPAAGEQPLSTPAFDYERAAVDKMLDFLTKKGAQRIESFQLQILCQAVEKKIISEGQVITADDLGNVEDVYENYYEDQLATLRDEGERQAARLLIEEGLVFEDEERRLSIFEGVIYRSYGLSADGLRRLVDSHLLRAEPSLQGGYNYELSHDTLVRPVLKAKRRRKQIEAEAAAERQKQQQEAEMEGLRLKAEEEERKRQEAERLREEAERQREEAQRQREQAELLRLEAVEQQEEAQRQRKLAEKRRAFSNRVLVGTLALLLVTAVVAVVAFRQWSIANEQRRLASNALAEKDLIDYRNLVDRGKELAASDYDESARQLFLLAKGLVDKNRDNPKFEAKDEEIRQLLQATE